jgi:hypothetical protein
MKEEIAEFGLLNGDFNPQSAIRIQQSSSPQRRAVVERLSI